MTEHWKAIAGYEGLYEVSDLGRVRSLRSGRYHNRQRILKPRSRSGYLVVCLYKDRKCTDILIHRLVAEAFIPNQNNLPEVNHLDEDKTNNVASNLMWVTSKENANYGTRNKRIGEANGKQVQQLDKNGNLLATFPSMLEASRQTGIAWSSIRRCCLGKLNSAGSFIWRYLLHRQCDAECSSQVSPRMALWMGLVARRLS